MAAHLIISMKERKKILELTAVDYTYNLYNLYTISQSIIIKVLKWKKENTHFIPHTWSFPDLSLQLMTSSIQLHATFLSFIDSPEFYALKSDK